MASFTNFATLTYRGGTMNSNTVTGELVEILTAAKNAIPATYQAGDTITYVISLVNTGTTALTGLTLQDDLGGYLQGTDTRYPLTYRDGTLTYYANGVLQTAPTVTAGPPLVITGITVPAGGDAVLIYQAKLTDYAPLDPEGSVVNTATITGTGITTALTAQATITPAQQAQLRITKAVTPTTVAENGQLTYTFVIENTGNTAAVGTDELVLTDTFNPILNNLRVTYNGTALTQGVGYTYNPATGVFATVAGQITVPAATFGQNADGTTAVTAGKATLTVTGTI